MTALSHVHVFEEGADPVRPPILLLHGTGGDESQLLPFGREVATGSALLSVRGRVLENGAARFFRRTPAGVLDEDDIRQRAGELAAFIAEACAAHGQGRPVAVGFSNGANIAAALLLLHPDALAGAVLLRPVAPLSQVPASGLAGKRVLIVSGEADAVAPPSRAAELARQLREAGAAVDHLVLPGEHPLSPQDAARTKEWLRRFC